MKLTIMYLFHKVHTYLDIEKALKCLINPIYLIVDLIPQPNLKK